MEAIAKTKYLKGSPRKARLVIDQIRGANVSRALSILRFTEKRAAGPITKCLSSAIANATYKAEQANIAIDPDDLWVKSCFVDMGPTKGRRRMRPAPQGRAYREQRHYCHITIEVTSEEKPKTEKELLAEAAKARRADAPKREKKKAAPKAEVKKAEETPVETIEETPAEVVETVETAADAVETPVETAADETVEATDETAVEAETVEAAEETTEEAAAEEVADATGDEAVSDENGGTTEEEK